MNSPTNSPMNNNQFRTWVRKNFSRLSRQEHRDLVSKNSSPEARTALLQQVADEAEAREQEHRACVAREKDHWDRVHTGVSRPLTLGDVASLATSLMGGIDPESPVRQLFEKEIGPINEVIRESKVTLKGDK